MGLIIGVGKDASQILDDLKEVLTVTFKIIISIVTIVQDIEDIVLELKDLSDMLHFSVNAVDENKVKDKINHIKDVAEKIGRQARANHTALDLVSMVIEDGLKMRYGKRNRHAHTEGKELDISERQGNNDESN